MGHIKEIVNIPAIALGIVVLGVFIMGLAFLGCCGAYCQSRVLMAIYFAIIVIIFIIQISLAIAATAYNKDVDNWVTTGWNKADNVSKNWVETQFKCCGLKNITDFSGSICNTPNNNTAPTAPPAAGCFYAVSDYIEGKLRIVEVAAGVIGAFEIIGFVFSCILCTQLPRYDKVWAERQRLFGSKRTAYKDETTSFARSGGNPL